MKMTSFAVFTSFILIAFFQVSHAVPLRLQKRAAFYIANETACVVDNLVYSNGDPIPTDDPCEACKCRPPGFACVLKDCQKKPGCRAIRRAGECCPEYICGCEHNGRMYRDGDEIRDAKNPCYTCHCQGSSIACAFVDCFFRVDCAPEYVQDKCCPEYNHCATTLDSRNISETFTTDSIEAVFDIFTEPPRRLEESSVEYVEPEDGRSGETLEETVEIKEQVLPPETESLADVIHRIAITVEDELESETTPGYQTTEAPAEYETPDKDSHTKSDVLPTTPQPTEESVPEEISSPPSEINEEISSDNQAENEVKLLNTELDGNAFEEVKEATPEEVISVSTSDDSAEIDTEATSTTGFQSTNGDIQTNQPTTEPNLQKDFLNVGEIPVRIAEIAKETNEIKRFRSLDNNGTEANLTTDDETKHSATETVPLNQDSSEESLNVDVEEVKQTPVPEVVSEQNESEKPLITEMLLSKIPEDKIAEYLISLKKTSTQAPITDETSRDSVTLVTITDNKPSETIYDETTTEIKEVTIELKEQSTPSSVTSIDAQEGLVKAFNDLADPNESREGAVILEEISTSQKISNDVVTDTTTESIAFETSTPKHTTQFKTVEHSTEDDANKNVSTTTSRNGTLKFFQKGKVAPGIRTGRSSYIEFNEDIKAIIMKELASIERIKQEQGNRGISIEFVEGPKSNIPPLYPEDVPEKVLKELGLYRGTELQKKMDIYKERFDKDNSIIVPYPSGNVAPPGSMCIFGEDEYWPRQKFSHRSGGGYRTGEISPNRNVSGHAEGKEISPLATEDDDSPKKEIENEDYWIDYPDTGDFPPFPTDVGIGTVEKLVNFPSEVQREHLKLQMELEKKYCPTNPEA
ncbi:hypothetical protein JTE90_000525 [Oedothorax gibbosus]|uniref:VWFC domain-containing protein n=1 Tax=Oedothorax gibbosus TaxID=931172 RepID=A0AAV6VU19_9ARAC|nr:hypothetical protein JTE90_000525 [Oedothorax gibbosus]